MAKVWYLLLGLPVMAATGLAFGVLAMPWISAVFGRSSWVEAAAGVVVFVCGAPLVAVPVAEVERWRLGVLGVGGVRSGHGVPARPGAWAWLRTRYREAATWREVGYALLLVTVSLVVSSVLVGAAITGLTWIVSPLLVESSRPVALVIGSAHSVREAMVYSLAGVIGLPFVWWLGTLAASGQAAVARVLLGGGLGYRLRSELVEVSRSRARLVDAFEAERTRIERDLHDGAQERLVSLTLRLGLARMDIPPESSAHQSVTDAHEQAKALMAELREIVRGIHPRVLTDRGLPAALGELADRSAVPVRVEADLRERPASHVETTAYFVASEALANVGKHSGANRASISVRRVGDVLTMEVFDDGKGGADLAGGSGLTGLSDRVAVIDGRMLLSSPVGGPTLLRVELPWSPVSG